MKICRKCQKIKPIKDFHQDKTKKDGVASYCRECNKRNASSWYALNIDRAKQNMQKNYVDNRRQRIEKACKYAKDNPEKTLARNMRRVARQLQRTPKWLTNDDFKLIEMQYTLAVYMTECTGISWEVDHIIPLQGKTISGLHVPYNLRVIPSSENRSKRNKF